MQFFLVIAAENVLDHFWNQFTKDVAAKDIVYRLERLNIISDGDVSKVMKESDERLQNEILHRCLRKKCTKVALKRVCEELISMKGNPRRKKLGEDMKDFMEGKCYAMSLYRCIFANFYASMHVCIIIFM